MGDAMERDSMRDPAGWRAWSHVAFSATVQQRALKVALIVGSLLLAINHADAILKGQIPLSRLLRMILTVIVPYVVSTVSSTGAILEMQQAPPAPEVPLQPEAVSPPLL